jgi:threonine/homoserine/homoserine lactone efflux protein
MAYAMTWLETSTLFLAASITLALVPGPDNIFVLTLSAMHGRLAGFLVTLGLCTGLIAHTAAVALGVAAIVQSSAWAFNVLKAVGAAYLLYFAWQAFRAGAGELPSAVSAAPKLGQLYRRGILMNITNPKVAIFFLAFLPQFVDPMRGSVLVQIGMLGALFIGATLLVFGTIAVAAGSLGKWIKASPRAQARMNMAAGMVFVLLAARLATSTR